MNHLLVSYHTCPMEEPGVGLSGGMNVFLRGLVPGLAARGIKTDVLTRGNGDRVQISRPFPGVRILHLPCGWKRPPSRESAHEALPRFIRSARELLAADGQGYDAVSAHYWMSGVAARAMITGPPPSGAIRLSMNRMVLMYHTVEERKTSPLGTFRGKLAEVRIREEKRLAEEAGRVVFLSRHDYERTRKVLSDVTGKSSIVPPGLDDAFRRPPARKEARRKAGIPPGAFLFLLAARPDPGKNIDAAVEAFRAIREEEGAGVRLLVAGQDNPGMALPAGAAFAGKVPHAEMPWLFAAADAVLCPSAYESFGLVPLEAMTTGIPVVVPAGGYWAERIRYRGGGLSYAPRAGRGLIDAMHAMRRDAAMRKRMGWEGRRIAAEFTWEKCTERWARILSICARRGSPR